MSMSSESRYGMRPLEREDLGAVAAWFHDPDDVALFDRSARMPLNRWSHDRGWEVLLDQNGARPAYWYMIEAPDGTPTGIVGLEGVSFVNGDAVIALYVEAGSRGAGVGIRAASLMLDLAFAQLGLGRVTSYYRSDNEPSRRLIARAGFTLEGRMRRAWFAGGAHADTVVVGLLAEEWAERRVALAAELEGGPSVALGAGGAWCWPRRALA